MNLKDKLRIGAAGTVLTVGLGIGVASVAAGIDNVGYNQCMPGCDSSSYMPIHTAFSEIANLAGADITRCEDSSRTDITYEGDSKLAELAAHMPMGSGVGTGIGLTAFGLLMLPIYRKED